MQKKQKRKADWSGVRSKFMLNDGDQGEKVTEDDGEKPPVVVSEAEPEKDSKAEREKRERDRARNEELRRKNEEAIKAIVQKRAAKRQSLSPVGR